MAKHHPITIAIAKFLLWIAYQIFWTFGIITWPLRSYWTARGKRTQEKLNAEHGTHILYGKCNLR